MIRSVGLLAALTILPCLGCSTAPDESLARIDSFEAWCRMASPGSQSDVDSAAVRDDLVRIWDDFLVSESLKVLGGGSEGEAAGDDPVLQELREIGMIGASAEGGTLWFGTGLMVPPILHPELETGSPEHFQALFRDYLDHAVNSDRPSDPNELGAICMWTAIPAFFDRWALVDGEGGLEIPMPRERGGD